MSSPIETLFHKIQDKIQQKLLGNPKLLFPCKYMVFHQAKKYCINCEDFVCDKCLKKHDQAHTVFTLNEVVENVSSKINLYLDLSNGKLPKSENDTSTTEKIELDDNIENNAIQTIDNLINKLTCIKKKMLSFFELRKQVLKKHNSEEYNVVYEGELMDRITTPEKLEIKEMDEKSIKEVYDIIKFEQNKSIIIKTFINFSKDLDNKTNEIIINNNYRNKLKNKNEMSVYERINHKTNELNLIMSDSFTQSVNSFLNKTLPYVDAKIVSTEDIFKNVVCAYLKIEEGEYQNLLDGTQIEDEPKKIVEKIVEKTVEVPKEVIVEKVVEKTVEVPGNKKVFSPNELFVNESNKIAIYIPSMAKEEGNTNFPNIYVNTEDENFDIKDILEPNQKNENNINNNNLRIDMPKKTSTLKRSGVIQKAGQIGSYASLALSAQNVKDIMKGTYNEAKAVIVINDNKYLVDSKEETEEYLKSCYNKLTEFNLRKVKPDFDLETELNKFKWKERNMFELVFPVEDNSFICVYNPYINKVQEIDIQTDTKFPINFSLLFKLPYTYVSGGKIRNENGELEELSTFYTIRRDGPKILEKILLPDMLESKSNHCLFEISYLNAICALGGRNSKDVEIYNLEEKNWTNLPDLNYPREGAACCVINESFLYCFFGYDSENASYLTSIEKMDLDTKNSWEVLNPHGNKSFMKKKYMGCVKYRKNFDENIYIVGGINVLNSESKDCLIYNEQNNTIEKRNDFTLPYKSSFNSCSFIQLPNSLFYNLSKDYQLIQYESLGKIFFGIRDS